MSLVDNADCGSYDKVRLRLAILRVSVSHLQRLIDYKSTCFHKRYNKTYLSLQNNITVKRPVSSSLKILLICKYIDV